MKVKKIITVVGARPQFVKAAVLSRLFKDIPGVEEKIIHTGQHFDAGMSDIFFQEMEIPQPHFHLDVNGVGHGAMTGRMLEKIEEVLITEKPDLVLVYGDTNSTLAGALAASKLHIKVAHVEAGLRSFNNKMPEEINRILTDRISSVLYAPTQTAVDNLKNEAFDNLDCEIVLSGDVMQDAALFYAQNCESKCSEIVKKINKKFILCTIHRAENTDDIHNLTQIVDAVNFINQTNPVVLPLHPRTQKLIDQAGLKLNAIVLPPVGYFDMLYLLKNCSLVMTDSGGLQKEAFFFAKNCVTMREQTEWVELVNGGFNVLSGADTNKIILLCNEMLKKENDFNVNLYGNGEAGKNITQHILKNI
jgi:UDP-GlcNAc3NAcA epimerase